MSSGKLETQTRTLTRDLSLRAESTGHTLRAADATVVIEAIATLGYPIGRYLREENVGEEFANGLPRIYARMRTAYYQNRGEFVRLKSLLQTRLQNVEISVLHRMAQKALDFAPMWMTRARAQGTLELLKGLL